MTTQFEFRRAPDGRPLWHTPSPAGDPLGSEFGPCLSCGQSWPCEPAKERTRPVPVGGIWLRNRDDGRVLEVLAEMDGEWRVVIRQQTTGLDDLISYIVEPLGMRLAKAEDGGPGEAGP